MPGANKQPTEKDFQTPNDFSSFIIGQHTAANAGKPLRTSASTSGVPQYAVTSFSLSDVLQGTYAVNNSSDNLLLINKALTQDLDGLYKTGASNLSSFSTVPVTPASNDGSTGGTTTNGGSTTGTTGVTSGGIIEATWVQTLPLEHPTTGAILWVRNGKGSREMHLPSSPDMASDKLNHKQYKEMPPEWQHPWNMDRKGGGVGGEATIYYDVDDSTSILGEAVNSDGQPGAFGILSPEDEQFYISMAWPYKGDPIEDFKKANREDIAAKASALSKSAYTGKKILVYSVQTKKACVCTPGDWGPHAYYSNSAVARASINGFYAGLAPDVHWALGTNHGSDFMFGWMPDETPVGPYGTASETGNTSATNVPRSGAGVVADDFVDLALLQAGKNYVFNTGSVSDPDPASFDCSGLVYWCAMSLGYKPPAGTPSDWSYSGTIIEMMKSHNTLMTTDDAIKTRGAILARSPSSVSGHVAISLGDGRVIEASSPKNGVGIFSATASYRNWTHCGWLPGMIFPSEPSMDDVGTGGGTR